jgi:PAS domain S-box-containing protein
MPEMDGFETTAAIRKTAKGLVVPIIFVTGNDTTSEREKGYTYGAVDFVSKFNEAPWIDVANVVDSLLSRKKRFDSSKVMLIATSPVRRKIVSSCLGRHGVDVKEVVDYETAISYAHDNQSDLDMVVIDFSTVGVDCLLICKNIRHRLHLYHIPIIFLITTDHQKKISEIFQAGATDYVKKPFTNDELLAKLLIHLEARTLVSRLNAEMSKNKMILEVAGEGVIGTRVDGRINFVNQAAADFVGMHTSGFVDCKLLDFVDTSTDVDIPNFREKNIGHSIFFRANRVTTFPVSFVASPIHDGKQVHGGVIVFKDISKQLKLEKERQEAMASLEEEMTRLAQEMAAAGALQKSLLPQKTMVNRISGLDIGFFSKAYNPVSGDFMIIEELVDGKVVVIIIDVMGHGVKAGLATIRLKTLFDDLKGHNYEPLVLIKKMNERAFTLSENGLFQTVLMAMVDPEQSNITIASAGGVPPLYYQQVSEKVFMLDISGNPVGIATGTDFIVEQVKIKLNSGDMFLFQTDGTIECTNQLNQPFDTFNQEKGKTLLGSGNTSQEVVAELVNKAVDFIGSDNFSDDVSVLVLKKE